MTEQSIFSLEARKMYQYLEKRRQEGFNLIQYNRKKFSEETGFTPTIINQAMLELENKEVILRDSTVGVCLIHLTKLNDDFESVIEEKILLHVVVRGAVKYNINDIAKRFSLGREQTQSIIDHLLETHYLEMKDSEESVGYLTPTALSVEFYSMANLEIFPPSSVSKLSVEHEILKYISQQGYVLLCHKRLSSKMKIAHEEVKMATNNLLKKKLIRIGAVSQRGNCLFLTESALKEYPSLIRREAVEVNEEKDFNYTNQQDVEEKILKYIVQRGIAKHNTKELSKDIGVFEAEVRRGVKSLREKNRIEQISVIGKGFCLSSLPNSNYSKTTATPIEGESSKLFKRGSVQRVSSKLKSFFGQKSIEFIENRGSSTVYLVDTENASHEKFYRGIETLPKTDQVVLMLTQNSRSFSNPKLLHQIVTLCPARIESFYRSVSGRNALDFVLISEASLRLAKDPKQRICVISEDKGFDAALAHLAQSLNLPRHQLKRQNCFK